MHTQGRHSSTYRDTILAKSHSLCEEKQPSCKVTAKHNTMQNYKREGKSKGREEIAWSPETNNNKNIFLLMRDNPKRDCKIVHNLGLKKHAK